MKLRNAPPQAARQRGVAVITALLLTTLAITIVASLFWQQQVQVRSMENQRLHLQTKWILRAGLDLSTLILREDLNHSGPNSTDRLDDFWAAPLEEVRLDEYIENGHKETDPSDATLSGSVTDASAMYNLYNMATVNQALGALGKADPNEVAVFQHLLTNLKLDSSLAQPAADVIANTYKLSRAVTSTSGKPMDFVQIEDLLSVPGFTPKIVEKLRPYAIFLPANMANPVNLFTASPEVLSARLNISLADAATIVTNRTRYRTLSDFLINLPVKPATPLNGDQIDVKSKFFLVNGKVRLNRASLDMQALVLRLGGGGAKVTTRAIWIREN